MTKFMNINHATPVNIPIEKLKLSELNNFEVNDIEGIKGSIMSLGLLTPLSVIGTDSDGMYTILSGERRFTAINSIRNEHKEMFREVPCLKVGEANMEKEIQQLIIEISNIETRDFDKTNHYFKIIRLLKECSKFKSRRALAMEMVKYINKSPRYTSMIIQVMEESTPNLLKAIEDGKITLSKADKLRKRIAKENDKREKRGKDPFTEDEIDEIVDVLKTGTNYNEVCSMFFEDEDEVTKHNEETSLVDTVPNDLKVNTFETKKDKNLTSITPSVNLEENPKNTSDVVYNRKITEIPSDKKYLTMDEIKNLDIDNIKLPEPDSDIGKLTSLSFAAYGEPDVKVTKKFPPNLIKLFHDFCRYLLNIDVITEEEENLLFDMNEVVEKFL